MRRPARAAVWFALVVGAWTLRGETLRIATYNVENYVAANRLTADGYRKDYPKPEVQKAALRAVIRALDADVLVLQEMGSAAYLEELQRDLKRDGVSYAHAVLLEAADADRHVALLARVALTDVRRHTDLSFTYFGAREVVKRGLLEVSVETSAGRLTIFGLHLKSRFTERPDDPRSSIRRLGEATAIRDAIIGRVAELDRAMFVIAGDFNDARSSKTLQRFVRRGGAQIAQLLPAMDSRGESWTHAFRKEDSYSRVDHILVSAPLMRRLRERQAVIFDIPEVREASDHRPVVVTIDFRENEKGGS